MSADHRVTTTADRVTTRLGALHVRIAGEGPTAVLWPSMFVDSHTWDPVLPLLPTGRRYILADGPGLGLSDPLTRVSDIDEAAGAALDLLAALGVEGPVDWIGNAFGGHVGYKLGAMPAVLRSLVTISAPASALPGDLRKQVRLLKPVLRLAGPVGPVRSAIIQAMLTDRAAADPRIRATVTASIRRPHRASMTRAVDSFILNRADVTAELARITVPCLFIASDDRGDWAPEDAEDAARRTPDATAVTVTGARTLVPLEQPAEVARLVTSFWSRLG
jgi:pimeloyl-ACP methyl ester carboxylesterase